MNVILVGAGHAHLFIASRAAEYLRRGCRLLLIDPGNFWYSGLATGMLGGMYGADEDQIDARALIEHAGGEFIRDRVIGIDTDRCELTLHSGETLKYDLLSLNIGSEVNCDHLGDPTHLNWWPVKPISNLYNFKRALDHSIFRNEHMPPVCVIGGGATGTEICANLLALAKVHGVIPNITLITDGDHLISDAPRLASRMLRRHLENRGAQLIFGQQVIGSETGRIVTDQGNRFQCEHAVLANGLKANSLTRKLGVASGCEGITVNRCMQSVDSTTLFASGDCADFEPRRLPKLGVFGVRAAGIVHHNLLASIDGQPLKAYRPQRIWLYILNLGNGEGLAFWWKFWWQGRFSLRLKDHIDRRFLQRYRRIYRT